MTRLPGKLATAYHMPTEQEGLPVGWTRATLDSLASSRKGKKPRFMAESPTQGLIPYIDIEAFETRVFRRHADRNGAMPVAAGDLIVVWDGARCGLVGIAPVEGALGSTLAVLDNPSVDTHYLLYYLRSQYEYINGHPRGSGITHIDPDLFWNLEVPVAPAAEQKRIASKIELLLSHIDAARERLAQVKTIMKSFRQAVLAAAVSGRLTADWRDQLAQREPVETALERLRRTPAGTRVRRGVPMIIGTSDTLGHLNLPDGWKAVSVAELLRLGALVDVKDGNHGANHPKSGEFTADGLPFITAAQVRDYAIDYVNAPKIAGSALDRLKVGFAIPDDVILTHKGSVGRAALNTRPCVLTPQTTYYRCYRVILEPRYLMYFLTSPQFTEQLNGVMSQTTRDFVPISEQYHLGIVLPSLEEQHEIVRRIDGLFTTAIMVAKRVELVVGHADRLTQVILAKAFRGELVSTEAELAQAQPIADSAEA